MVATSKLSYDQSNPRSSSCKSISSQVNIRGKIIIQGSVVKALLWGSTFTSTLSLISFVASGKELLQDFF